MWCLLIPAVIASLAWANIVILRMFQRRRTGPRWWAALSAAWLFGAALGVWGGFFLEYELSTELRVHGAPVPAAFFHQEGPPGQEQWIDFISSAPLVCAGSNVVILALLAACPVGWVFWLRRWQAPSGAEETAQNRP
jgi:hypothetical protein